MPLLSYSRRFSAPLMIVALCATPSFSQYTPVFFDGFDIAETEGGVGSNNINQDLGAPRQGGGDFIPVSFVTNSLNPSDDYHHQLFPPSNVIQPLQLAGDGNFPPGAPPIFAYKTMVSPDANFDGSLPQGIVGKRITFDLDVASVIADNTNGVFTSAGITIGSGSTLVDAEDQIGVQDGLPLRDYFSLQFVEDTFNAENAENPFLQIGIDGFLLGFDEAPEVPIAVPHNGGFGQMAVQLDIDDPSDGNPWDGIGSTVIEVFVNDESIFVYEKADGGYVDNYLTLFGNRNLVGNGLATHLFDNLTVYAAPDAAIGGDYNFDGVVNAADYTVFRDNEGEAISLPGEDPVALTPGLVDEEDYIFWRDNYGQSATAAASVAVPEPTTIVLGLLGVALCCRHR